MEGNDPNAPISTQSAAPAKPRNTLLTVVLIVLAVIVCICLAVVIVVVLALLGPSTSDIFSNIILTVEPVP
ncbi:hypothetical protein [Bellilinea sp.]|uniref:hypothetical protein n=1 Tax=Bellilinea sp. TaxID=2838785 RepID=UPI002ADE3537|nr:hypothetical protein [Bellilinea sp.]